MPKAPAPKSRSQAKPQQQPKPKSSAKPKAQGQRQSSSKAKPPQQERKQVKPATGRRPEGQAKQRPDRQDSRPEQQKRQPQPRVQPQPDEKEGARLNKYISDTGRCSRREADKLIEQGRVKVNGKKAVMGTRIGPSDQVTLDGEAIGATAGEHEELVYLAFHKPVGITCTTETHVRGNIIDYINFGSRIFPIGRLDKPSEGLIFLTNDGNIVNKILRAGNQHEKEYIVTVDKPITAEFIRRMGNGIPILDTVTQKCFVEQVSKFVFRIILTQGLNRQIRRMCEYLGYNVTALKRTRIMNVTLDRLPPGQWRYLSKAEMKAINNMVAASAKTEEASLPRQTRQNRNEEME